MKKIIYGSIVLGLIAVASLSSCKKDEVITPTSTKTIETSRQDQVHWLSGRKVIFMGGKTVVVGTYMRTLKDSFIWGFGCHLPQTNCLPDHEVSSNGNNHDDITNDNYNMSEAVANDFNNSFGIPMVTAVQNGASSIKTFFNDVIVQKTNLPEQLVIDFNNDLLTIKEFGGNYFIVNTDATSPSEFPIYN